MSSFAKASEDAPPFAGATGGADAGSVKMSLGAYQALRAKAADPKKVEVPPPVASTVSRAQVEVTVPSASGRPARVQATVVVHLLEDRWTGVPLLPVGTAVASATSSGQPLSLGERDGQLIWAVKGTGSRQIQLDYSVPITEASAGRALQLPVPPAATLGLTASLPGQGLKVAVLPASGVEVSEQADRTRVQASLPRTSGVLITWLVPAAETALIVSADYAGVLRRTGQERAVVTWTAELAVKVLTPDPVELPVLAASAAVARAEVDGKPAVVKERGGHLAIQLRGVGRHEVTLGFETRVVSQDGPPGTDLWLPRPPQGAFRLDLPGDKVLEVQPAAGVHRVVSGGRTRAEIHLPPSDSVRFSWSEALPADQEQALQANAEVYHVVRAEEGVLQIQAEVAYQVSRGATNQIQAWLPAGVAVNGVTGEGVTDWRVKPSPKRQKLTVFLDRDLTGELRFKVDYERLLGAGAAEKPEPVELPLLTPEGTLRQRGMVALVSGPELSMKPRQANGMNKVGENQLPAWVRGTIHRTVAHTYKFIDPASSLAVQLAPPERKQGKFDASVDTLYSVGDGVMKASASVEVAIKTGRLMELDLSLPAEVNLVGVTAPSLRDHELAEVDGSPERRLRLMFTQELEGSLRVEVAFERVLAGGQEQVPIPVVHVPGADMEQGRLAVEALTAVEVQTAEAVRVLPLDVQELPRQLTLRTTNPILLAYKYVHAEPPLSLVLEVRHHAEMQVQVAAIDRAAYQTLYTRHGLSLTRAVYQLRNRRKQFLKVHLPAGSELWSAGLNGQPVKPARSDEADAVLVPLVNSAASFTVEIVYATKLAPLGFAGTIDGLLPVPDIVETRSTWDVYLPTELSYGQVDANMSVGEGGAPVELTAQAADRFALVDGAKALDGNLSAETGGRGTEQLAGERTAGVLPLQIEVPRSGIHYRFEKLFANRGEERSRFSIRYSTAAAGTSGGLLALLGLLAFVGGAGAWLGLGRKLSGRTAAGLAGGGLLVTGASIWMLSASPVWALVGLIAGGLWLGIRVVLARRVRGATEAV